jgi:ferredoxin/flavodoxin---NADP+ reductase
MFERLPTPYGLVRAGIAPDHQHTKAVTRLFEHIAAHERFRFHGNVAVGVDVELRALSDHYDAVVLAFGATGDRPLGIPGEYLAGCLTATEFVGWYNGHPDFTDLKPELNSGPVVVIGNGNVAADVARVIMSPVERLGRTDIADHALAKIKLACVQSVHVVGRKGCRDARFTLPELKQLANIPGVRPVVNPRDIGDADGAVTVPIKATKSARMTTNALRTPFESYLVVVPRNFCDDRQQVGVGGHPRAGMGS